MSAPHSAVIVGGGIVGLSIAIALEARGVATTVFDAPTDLPPASFGNAGHIATEQTEPLASLATLRSLPARLTMFGGPVRLPLRDIATWAPFGLRLLRAARPASFVRGRQALAALMAEALPAWRRIATRISAPDLLREGGHMVLWDSAAGARRGRAALAGFGSPDVRWRDLTSNDSALLAGALTRAPVDGVRFEGTASVADPGAVLAAMRTTLLARGGAIENCALSLAEASRRGADIVVVAAGVRSRALMNEAGHAAPLIAERGYHIHSAAAHWPEAAPPLVFEERALVATGFRSGLRATSFTEFTRANAPPDPRAWATLRCHAAELGLPFDSSPREWFGARPTLPDYLPAIGRSRRDARLLYAFGHQHLGLTLGPISGEIVAALACGEPPPVSVEPFAIERFG